MMHGVRVSHIPGIATATAANVPFGANSMQSLNGSAITWFPSLPSRPSSSSHPWSSLCGSCTSKNAYSTGSPNRSFGEVGHWVKPAEAGWTPRGNGTNSQRSCSRKPRPTSLRLASVRAMSSWVSSCGINQRGCRYIILSRGLFRVYSTSSMEAKLGILCYLVHIVTSLLNHRVRTNDHPLSNDEELSAILFLEYDSAALIYII